MSVRVLLTLLIGVTCTACYTWRTVPLSTGPAPTILPWHRVRITFVNGRKQVVYNPSVTADTLYAWRDRGNVAPDTVPMVQIRRLETGHFSAGKTIGWTLGIAGGALLIGYVALLVANPDIGITWQLGP